MPALSVFKLPKAGLKVTFDQDDHFISLGPKTHNNKHVFDDVLNHLQTLLQTDSLKITNNSATMKVGENVDVAVLQGALRGKGFSGGEAIEDSASVAEKNNPEFEQKPPEQPIPQTEALWNMLSGFLNEGTYRTAKYWQDLFQYAGKRNKSAIDENDILRLRKIFSKKPKSQMRDKLLRATDKAARYFTKKIRRTVGDSAAADFKDRYKSIGGLAPHDYADPMDAAINKGVGKIEPIAPPQDIDLSDFFSGDDYDDIEIERT